jgi:predicted nucleic acid-binding protein
MKIVVDTNVVFSTILSSDSSIGDLLLNSDPTFQFYTCHLLIEELERHKSKIFAIKDLSETEFEIIKNEVFRHLNFVSEEIIPFEFWSISVPLLREVDMDDIAFVALSQFLQTTLWTGDKRLISGLRSKGFVSVITTTELYQLRQEIEH